MCARLLDRKSSNGAIAMLVAREIPGITGMALRPPDSPESPVRAAISVPKEMLGMGLPGNRDQHHRCVSPRREMTVFLKFPPDISDTQGGWW